MPRWLAVCLWLFVEPYAVSFQLCQDTELWGALERLLQVLEPGGRHAAAEGLSYEAP